MLLSICRSLHLTERLFSWLLRRCTKHPSWRQIYIQGACVDELAGSMRIDSKVLDIIQQIEWDKLLEPKGIPPGGCCSHVGQCDWAGGAASAEGDSGRAGGRVSPSLRGPACSVLCCLVRQTGKIS